MRGMMRLGLPVCGAVLVVAALAAGERARATDAGPGSTNHAQTCRKAEVNPVTGHVLCIDPLGAPVEAPPAASDVPCKADAYTDAVWTWGPKCTPQTKTDGT